MKQAKLVTIALIVGLSAIPSFIEEYSVYTRVEPPREVAVKGIQVDHEYIKETISIEAQARGLDPVLVLEIVRCESQFNPEALGTKAKVGKDYGLLQVNSYFHADTMEKLGMDINDPDDSLIYGLDLMESQGVSPWSASRHCWEGDMMGK